MAPLNPSKPAIDYKPSSWGPLSPLAGGRDGKFFHILPDWVDPSLPPGTSPLPTPTAGSWLWSAVTLHHVWASPNTFWSLIALGMYFLFPYDLAPGGLSARGPVTVDFFLARFPLWFAVTFLYTAFWHVSLYGFGWGSRPFVTGRVYNWDKVLHDGFFFTSGVAIWTAFDNVFSFLWATGRLPYMSDAEAGASAWGVARFIAALIAVPLWRDAHFYFGACGG